MPSCVDEKCKKQTVAAQKVYKQAAKKVEEIKQKVKSGKLSKAKAATLEEKEARKFLKNKTILTAKKCVQTKCSK